MAWWNRNKTKVQGLAEQDNTGQWFQYFRQYMDYLTPDKLEVYKPENSYILANGLAEIFIPIDAIAEREASINYDLVYESTGEEYIPEGNLKRLISQPNLTDRFNDLIYKMSFSELATGESFTYTKIPDRLKTPTADNIATIWVLNPSVTTAKIRKEVPNPFLVIDKQEIIEYYKTFFLYDHKIEPKYVLHRTVTGMDEHFRACSPLNKVQRNINNLLAVYQARYNVYAKNGNGGILSRDSKSVASDMSEVVDPVTRDQILKDIQSRNGITGNKNFMSISSIPLKFIKTLGTISELEPFKETEADMISIGGIFGVDKYLLPISEGTTFTNKQDAEKGLWQNVIKGRCEDRAKDLSRVFALPEGVVFKPNFNSVEVLQEDKKTAYESDAILIDNLSKLTEAGQNVTQGYMNLTDKYNA